MKVLVIGDGLLGSCLVSKTGWNYISRKKNGIDFTRPGSYANLLYGYDCIVNCVADTNTYSNDKKNQWDVNYKAVADLVKLCNDTRKKLVHISSDYIYTNSKSNCSEEEVPVHCATWYGYTKLVSDAYVQLESKDYLVIRCTHKPNPFPYEKAFVNLVGNFDYVDTISEIIAKLIEKQASGVYNVGTDLKSMYQMAKETSPEVQPTTDSIDINMPSDVSMDLTKLNDFLSWK